MLRVTCSCGAVWDWAPDTALAHPMPQAPGQHRFVAKPVLATANKDKKEEKVDA